MKKIALTLLMILASAVTIFAAGKGESFKYAIGICYTTPETDADRAVIRAILATLDENEIEAMSYDVGTESAGMLARVDLLLEDRGVYAIIIVCQDQALAVEVTAKCSKVRVPVAILGKGPEDLESFPAIVVNYNERRGHEQLMETAVALCGTKTETIQPLIITPEPDSDSFRQLLDRFNAARYKSGNNWKDPLFLKPGVTRSETRDFVTGFLKINREVNLIILPGSAVEHIRSPLMGLGKWLDSDDPLHVVVGCMDGSSAAVKYMSDGYVDLIGGRDVVREAESLVYPLIENIKTGKKQSSLQIPVPGRIITRGDLSDKDRSAWDENLPLVPPYQKEQ
jgi:ABC-type sugar transport system substrate-binding protein